MPRIWTTLIATVVLALTAPSARAQDICAGDCDGNHDVAINELITCVNIALGSTPVSMCTACDVDGNGSVEISELIAAVNAALNGCPTPGGARCGDGTKDAAAGEECDDGNNFGGDGCAANCTTEVSRMTVLDPDLSKSTVEAVGFQIPVTVTGTQVLTAGRPRDTAVLGPDGQQLFAPGEFPLALKTEDAQFNPVVVPGIACACVRALPVPEFGPGISGIGLVGCGAAGLTDVNVLVSNDHNTTPGSPGNSGSAVGLPDDPECNDTTDAGEQVTGEACLEAQDATCNATNRHKGVCNSPRVVTFSGGQGVRGSTILRTRTAIGLLNNATNPDPMKSCEATKDAQGNCRAPDFGPDCIACTADDKDLGRPNTGVTTSGTASAILYDANNSKGLVVGVGKNCAGRPCVASVTGEPTDCDALEADPNGPLQGSLVTAFAGLDSNIGDTVTTTKLAAQK